MAGKSGVKAMTVPLHVWQNLVGVVVAERFRLSELRLPPGSSGQGLGFVADRLDGSGPVLIRLWPEDEGAAALIQRHLEASFLRHPNLLPCLGSGQVQLDAGPYVWAAYAMPEVFLHEMTLPAPPDALQALGVEIVEGLKALHAQGLVFGGLDLSTVARWDDRWVLADYSQMRLAGTGYQHETRRLLGTLPGAPPEAYFGDVGPAWDVWGLARLLRLGLIGGDASGRRDAAEGSEEPLRPEQPQSIPEPFSSILSGCLRYEPTERCTLADIEQMLRSAQLDRHHPVSAPAAATAAEYTAQPAPDVEPIPYVPVPSRVEDPAPTVRSTPIMARPAHKAMPHETLGSHWRGRMYGDEEGIAQPLWRKAWVWALAGVVALLIFFVWRFEAPRAEAVKKHAPVNPPVFGDEPLPAQTRAGDRAAIPANEGTRSRVPSASTNGPEQVRDTVQDWARTLRQGDLAPHVSYYAQRMDRYFLQRGVAQSFVQRDKADLFRNSKIEQLDISEPKVRMRGADRAVVTFDKTWRTSGSQPSSGKARSELQMRRTAEGWKIVSERDTKVYWKKTS
jgi:ketosteroid isomerase-like protein